MRTDSSPWRSGWAAALIFALAWGLSLGPAAAKGPRAAATSEPGEFDYYLLTLSWSPAHCAAHPDDRPQCEARRFQFVVHGLWPQFMSGGFPQSCASEPLRAEVVDRALAFMPSRKLIQHEWEKHGTCSGLDDAGYFDAAERAFESVTIPSTFGSLQGERLHIDADDIVEMFKTANQDLDDGMIVVKCSGKELQEVRICMDKELRFAACGKGVRMQCGKAPILVRPVR